MGGEGRIFLNFSVWVCIGGNDRSGVKLRLCDTVGDFDRILLPTSNGLDSGGDIKLAIDGNLGLVGSSMIIVGDGDG